MNSIPVPARSSRERVDGCLPENSSRNSGVARRRALFLPATWTRGAGDSVNVGELTLSTHTGTHLDAPYHFDDRGAAAGDLDVDIFIGPALVVFLVQPERIEPSQFASVDFDGFSRLLVRTDSWEDLETFPHSSYKGIGLRPTSLGSKSHGLSVKAWPWPSPKPGPIWKYLSCFARPGR